MSSSDHHGVKKLLRDSEENPDVDGKREPKAERNVQQLRLAKKYISKTLAWISGGGQTDLKLGVRGIHTVLSFSPIETSALTLAPPRAKKRKRVVPDGIKKHKEEPHVSRPPT